MLSIHVYTCCFSEISIFPIYWFFPIIDFFPRDPVNLRNEVIGNVFKNPSEEMNLWNTCNKSYNLSMIISMNATSSLLFQVLILSIDRFLDFHWFIDFIDQSINWFQWSIDFSVLFIFRFYWFFDLSMLLIYRFIDLLIYRFFDSSIFWFHRFIDLLILSIYRFY